MDNLLVSPRQMLGTVRLFLFLPSWWSVGVSAGGTSDGCSALEAAGQAAGEGEAAWRI